MRALRSACVVVVAFGASCGGGGGGGGPITDPSGGPVAGNPNGACSIPGEAQPEDTSNPTTVIGDGTPASCTSDAVIDGIAQGGIITFDCGPDPIVITLEETAKIYNDTTEEIVIDGGSRVTLSGGGENRILYMNTCDQELVWLTNMCQNQNRPRLTIQNITFVDGNSRGQLEEDGGGGAILVRGGRLKIINSRFFNNQCENTGRDIGGGAVRVLSQFDGEPVFVVNSTFGGGEGYGNQCANGGALSSIQVSWTVINSLFLGNRAVGMGANLGNPGGGNGGAIYNDGDDFTLRLCGTHMESNHANEGGGAIFYVSNNETGDLIIRDSTLRMNVSEQFETLPGIFMIADDGNPMLDGSTIE